MGSFKDPNIVRDKSRPLMSQIVDMADAKFKKQQEIYQSKSKFAANSTRAEGLSDKELGSSPRFRNINLPGNRVVYAGKPGEDGISSLKVMSSRDYERQRKRAPREFSKKYGAYESYGASIPQGFGGEKSSNLG